MNKDRPKARSNSWLVPGLIILAVVIILLAQAVSDLTPAKSVSAQVLSSPITSDTPESAPSPSPQPKTPTAQSNATSTVPPLKPSATLEATPLQPSPTPLPTLTTDNWKAWPVVPIVSEQALDIYQRGLDLGNDPQAFSVLGDCQSLPESFMGLYDTNPSAVQELPSGLRETVLQFKGSFSRMGPTLKAGTTSAAVLWYAWHEEKYGCGANESPLDCEIRLTNPSIAIINLGTHYETRNIEYLRKILDKLIEKGILPVLSTKADNRELDERLNFEMASLALEYEIPLWNFYAAVSHLPDNGVSIRAGEEHLGVIYLTPEALEIHYFTALQALDAVWKAVR